MPESRRESGQASPNTRRGSAFSARSTQQEGPGLGGKGFMENHPEQVTEARGPSGYKREVFHLTGPPQERMARGPGGPSHSLPMGLQPPHHT